MVAGRRAVSIHEDARWVCNRVVGAYGARPRYPAALIDAVAELGTSLGGRVADIGAGTGYLALPLAARGLQVIAVEPARAMLDRLREDARAGGLTPTAVHAAAEALPLDAGSVDLAVLADALHFLDVERSASELSRVLALRGGLALVTVDFGDTPFMRAVKDLMDRSAPRRPRESARASVQLFALTGVRPEPERRFDDETPVTEETLERILRSISFIGPAMNPARTAAFSRALRALPGPRVWARRIALKAGRRRGRLEAGGWRL